MKMKHAILKQEQETSTAIVWLSLCSLSRAPLRFPVLQCLSCLALFAAPGFWPAPVIGRSALRVWVAWGAVARDACRASEASQQAKARGCRGLQSIRSASHRVGRRTGYLEQSEVSAAAPSACCRRPPKRYGTCRAARPGGAGAGLPPASDALRRREATAACLQWGGG